jgi:hypothetical protein
MAKWRVLPVAMNPLLGNARMERSESNLIPLPPRTERLFFPRAFADGP